MEGDECFHRTISIQRDPKTGEPVRLECLGPRCDVIWKVEARSAKQGALF